MRRLAVTGMIGKLETESRLTPFQASLIEVFQHSTQVHLE